jgi:hypothetical protein
MKVARISPASRSRPAAASDHELSELLVSDPAKSCCSCMATTKPGALAPGICLLSRGCVPGARAQGGRAQLCGRLIVLGAGGFQLWSELPALAPGARCRLGRSVGSGAPSAMQWTATVATRQERQRSVESVGAGAGSSARSWLVLRGGVFHQWSLRIPLPPRWARPAEPARAAAHSTPVFIGGNGSS